jgi:hypothetical protein
MSVSSLLKSAQSTQAKIQAANDAEVAFEWQSSAQTYDDYLAYHKYLDDQAAKTTDPTKLLTYSTTQRSALRSYQSNEIQRASQEIQYGSASIQDKQQLIENLVNQAQAIGDENQVQNLISQWNTLSIQAQNQADAAAATARSTGSANATAANTALKNQVYDLVNQTGALKDVFVQAINQSGTPQDAAKNIDAINKQLPPDQQIDPSTGVFDIASAYADTVSAVYKQAIQVAGDVATANDLAKEYDKFAKGTILTLPSPSGSEIKLNAQDVQKQVALSNVGQSMFTESAGPGGKTYIQNKIDNYEFGHDQNGNVVAIPTYSATGMDFNQNVTDLQGNAINDSKTKKQANYKQLLQNAGFQVVSNNGVNTIQDITGQNRLNGSDTAQIYLTEDGRLQFVQTPTGTINPDSPFQDNQVFDLSFDKNGQFNGINKQSADPFLKQYDANYRGGDTPYFLAHPDQAQGAFGTAGLLTPQTMQRFGLDVGNAGTIHGVGLSGGLPQFSSPTSLLQNASLRQQASQANLQAAPVPQIVAAPPVQLQAPSLASSILANNQRATITVAKPQAPSATISIKPQTGGGAFLGVSNKPNTSKITF